MAGARGGQRGGVITSGHVWAFIIMGAILFIVIVGIKTDQGYADAGGAQWRVESVYRGKVQVTSVKTGEASQIDDAELVKKCLSGKVKKGDIIEW
jgi:uncharacterized membrane protein